ncbi:LuxR family transcriptional regulator [Streptococcus ruminicola]|uniref:LuxR family transcriptional regulator n=2 Tax=Streptococcus TaxID=1301 RepID=A0A091BTZ7_STREI|nr:MULTISPECIES: DUF6440 family protein [Streptococcus]KFN88219.1 LuxR family transcriptional regulator [Streptococcus equinus JB1]QIM45933.1 LuxR family transcriptional regulator [Streptococcus ruminicola]SFL04722.1 hypothetical protein SAMN02910290_00214 [Streptococcus equinus JB1]
MEKKELRDYQKQLKERFFSIQFDNKKQNLTLLVDHETGVEYLEVIGGLGDPSGITPLLNSDGTPKINERWKDNSL